MESYSAKRYDRGGVSKQTIWHYVIEEWPLWATFTSFLGNEGLVNGSTVLQELKAIEANRLCLFLSKDINKV